MNFRVKVMKSEETWIDVDSPNEAEARRQVRAIDGIICVLGVNEAPITNPLIDNTPPELSVA